MKNEYEDGTWFFCGFPIFFLGFLLLLKLAGEECGGATAPLISIGLYIIISKIRR